VLPHKIDQKASQIASNAVERAFPIRCRERPDRKKVWTLTNFLYISGSAVLISPPFAPPLVAAILRGTLPPVYPEPPPNSGLTP
jgi:hypothetical protein